MKIIKKYRTPRVLIAVLLIIVSILGIIFAETIIGILIKSWLQNCGICGDELNLRAQRTLTLIILGFCFLLLNAGMARISSYIYEILDMYSGGANVTIEKSDLLGNNPAKAETGEVILANSTKHELDFDPLAIKILALAMSTLIITPQAIHQLTPPVSNSSAESRYIFDHSVNIFAPDLSATEITTNSTSEQEQQLPENNDGQKTVEDHLVTPGTYLEFDIDKIALNLLPADVSLLPTSKTPAQNHNYYFANNENSDKHKIQLEKLIRQLASFKDCVAKSMTINNNHLRNNQQNRCKNALSQPTSLADCVLCEMTYDELNQAITPMLSVITTENKAQ